jgi:hypothetical protein
MQETAIDKRPVVYHGVDFSGSASHRQKMWIASQVPGQPATTRSGLSHADLVELMRRSAADGCRHWWLIDAPLALPVELLERHKVPPTWPAALAWISSFGDAQAWRRACRSVSRREAWRGTDRRAQTPLPPTNLRVFKQTYHAIVSVVARLRALDAVIVLPMELAGAEGGAGKRLDAATACIGEGCPSSTLQRLGWPHRGYKGPAERNRELRQELLDRLVRELGSPVAPAAAAAAVDDPEGDALDSLLMLPAARAFAAADHAVVLAADSLAHVEGWVYV